MKKIKNNELDNCDKLLDIQIDFNNKLNDSLDEIYKKINKIKDENEIKNENEIIK